MFDNEPVYKFYTMNPETEDVLGSGWKLKVDMVVLIESPLLRLDRIEYNDAGENDRLLLNNRWCKVAEVCDRTDRGTLIFIGEYADGVKRQRRVPVDQAWIVKKDSLPDEKSPEQLHEELREDLRANVDWSDMPDHDRPVGSELLGTVTDIREDVNGLTVEGELNDDDEGEDDDDSVSSYDRMQDGPMVRAMRREDIPPQLREKRTVTKNEVIEIYGPGRSIFGSPYYSRRRNW